MLMVGLKRRYAGSEDSDTGQEKEEGEERINGCMLKLRR